MRFDDGREIDVLKASYVALKRQPPFEDLPMEEDFEERRPLQVS